MSTSVRFLILISPRVQGSEWESKWVGSNRGDEVCEILNTELELSDTIDVFPEGLSLGYYYNYCQEEEWKDTGARSEVRVCCQGGKARDCQEILEDYEEDYEEEAQAADLTKSGGATNHHRNIKILYFKYFEMAKCKFQGQISPAAVVVRRQKR